MKEDEPSRAKKNWNKVKNIIMSKSLAHKQKDKNFVLFDKETKVEENCSITYYRSGKYQLIQATPLPLYKELLHFKSQLDATGKWVWEAEVITAYYLLQTANKYLPKGEGEEEKKVMRILELGAGCSGLASISLSAMIHQNMPQISLQVLISDGQEENIPFLSKNIQLNGIKEAKASVIKWGDEQVLANLSKQGENRMVFDLIVVCDCLYFTQFHQQLILTLHSYLSNSGTVLLVNPQRGDSMICFLSLAECQNFIPKTIDFIDPKYQSELMRIKTNPTYNEDKDLPFFIELHRKGNKM